MRPCRWRPATSRGCKHVRFFTIHVFALRPQQATPSQRVHENICMFPLLQALDVSNCSKLTDAALRTVAARWPSLLALNIANLENVTDAAVAATLAALPRLRQLSLRDCDRLGDGAVGAAGALTALTHLNLRNVPGLTDAGVAQLGGLSRLQHLDMYNNPNVTAGPLVPLLAANPGLRHLDLGCCEAVDDVAAQCIARMAALTHLSLSGGMSGLSESGVALFANCAALSCLSLRCADGATDASVAAVCAGCRALEQLDLSHCSNLSGAALGAVATLPRLQSLALGFSPAPDDDGLRRLSAGARSLRELDLQRNWHTVTDAGIFALVGAFPLLESANLDSLGKLTDASVAAFVASCPRLSRLNLKTCAELTPALLPALAHIKDVDHDLTPRQGMSSMEWAYS